MAKQGKKYLAALAKVDEKAVYEPQKALELVKETAFTKFDATVEVHMRTGPSTPARPTSRSAT